MFLFAKPPPAYLSWLMWAMAALFYLMAFFQRIAPAVMTNELMRDQIINYFNIKGGNDQKEQKITGADHQRCTCGPGRNQMKACADIRVDMHSAAYQTEQEMMTLLTDEQKEKLKTIMEEHDDMMKKGTLKN
jgi:hypothetical protein